jgi:uncharacterized iron-regulated protein
MPAPVACSPSRRRLLAAAAGLLATGGCAGPAVTAGVPDGAGLDGRIWDVRAGRFLARGEALARAARARLLLLGETHDNAWHHRIQAEVLDALIASGRRPALVMEQFDTEHQAAMDAARRDRADAEALARAGRFDARGWEWAYYKPLVEAAVAKELPVLAANLSRNAARELVRAGGAGVAVPAALRGALERDIRDGHCGMDLPGSMMAGMVAAQSARDARMAQVLASAAGAAGAGGAVLVAGRAHVRRDRGAPAYLDETARAGLLSIGLMEAGPDDRDPLAFLDGTASAPAWDLLWFSRRMARPDPCAALRKPAAPAG